MAFGKKKHRGKGMAWHRRKVACKSRYRKKATMEDMGCLFLIVVIIFAIIWELIC